MYAGGFGNQILTDWGFLQKKKKTDLAENFSKNSAFCLFKSWECGSHRYLVGLTRAHSGSLGLARARSVCWCLELISVSFQPYDLEP